MAVPAVPVAPGLSFEWHTYAHIEIHVHMLAFLVCAFLSFWVCVRVCVCVYVCVLVLALSTVNLENFAVEIFSLSHKGMKINIAKYFQQ